DEEVGKPHVWDTRPGTMEPVGDWSRASLISCSLCLGFDLAFLGRDLLPWSRTLDAFDHHAIVVGKAAANQAQALDHGTELDTLAAHRAVVGHHKDDFP